MWKKAGISLTIPICCKLHRTSPFFWTTLNIFGIYFFLEGVHDTCSDSLLTLTLYLFGIRWHAFVITLLYVRIFLGTSSPEAVMAEVMETYSVRGYFTEMAERCSDWIPYKPCLL
jgi:hypothetical protein